MQTAVETLIAKIKAVKPTQFCSIETILEWCEQAKEMEKQQIIDAFDEGQEYEYQVFVNSAPRFFSDTYYNETYGSKGSDECQFEQTTNTSSATICKHCGREKFLHQ